MAQVEDDMLTVRTLISVNNEQLRRIIADQRLRHDFNVCQRLPKTPRKPTAKEFRMNQEAVVMFTYIAAGYCFVHELINELKEAGIYRQATKRAATRTETILQKASRTAEDALKTANNGKASTGYFDCMDAFYEKIDASIALSPPERAYNIILAIGRLVGEYNKKLGEYHFVQSYEVAKIPSILEQVPIDDYRIDNIIDMAVRPIVFDRKF